MKSKFWLIIFCLLAACLVIGGCDKPGTGWFNIGNPKGQPLEVKVVADPNQEARIADLEKRVKTVEDWMERQGRRYK